MAEYEQGYRADYSLQNAQVRQISYINLFAEELKMSELFKQPHKRYNPLTDEWILVSPHRLQRPWQGKVEQTPPDSLPQYDPKCYLCPGNERAGGHRNPSYEGVFVFDNDFSALLPNAPKASLRKSNLMRAQSEKGICRVICYSPRHDLTMAELPTCAVETIVETWTEEYQRLGSMKDIAHVQIFENKGAIMGCSNPHPHGQIWATQTIPTETARELKSQKKFASANGGKCLLCEYLKLELQDGERIICANDEWLALVPFWAKWPFETMILPKRHADSLASLDAAQRRALADILKKTTTRYDNIFNISFPYTMGLHQEPTDGKPHPFWHLHIHFYPPLLRSATVQKFMVGFEMLANAQRDITPEQAAERLRSLPEEHFRLKSI